MFWTYGEEGLCIYWTKEDGARRKNRKTAKKADMCSEGGHADSLCDRRGFQGLDEMEADDLL